MSDEGPVHLQEEILEPVFMTDKAVQLVLSDWAFEGARECKRAWSDSHRTFSAMDFG